MVAFATPRPTQLFPLGRTVMTPGVRDLISLGRINPQALMQRHHAGDWGDVSDNDKASNNAALDAKNPDRIISSYLIDEAANLRIMVVTERDRSSTCMLLSSEY